MEKIKFSNFDTCINIAYLKTNETSCVYDDDENEILLRLLSGFCLKRQETMNENLRFDEKFKPVCIPISILIYSEQHCLSDITLVINSNISNKIYNNITISY